MLWDRRMVGRTKDCLNKIMENNGMSCLWYAIPLLLKNEEEENRNPDTVYIPLKEVLTHLAYYASKPIESAVYYFYK